MVKHFLLLVLTLLWLVTGSYIVYSAFDNWNAVVETDLGEQHITR